MKVTVSVNRSTLIDYVFQPLHRPGHLLLHIERIYLASTATHTMYMAFMPRSLIRYYVTCGLDTYMVRISIALNGAELRHTIGFRAYSIDM